MSHEIAVLRTIYERFNARDVDGVLAVLDDGVLWANGVDGGHVEGKEGVRAYWTRQWAQVDPRVEPISFAERGDGEVAVDVRLELFDLSGKPLAVHGGLQAQTVRHVYRFADGKVRRFDIEAV